MTGSLLHGVLRRDRAVAAGGLLAAIALSWAYLLAGAGMSPSDMDGMAMPSHLTPWTIAHAGVVFLMWSIMMAAMMLPSAAPMILLYGTLASRRWPGKSAPLLALFAAGYVLAWAGFGLAAVGLQFGLEEALLLSPAMETTSIALAGAVLIAAGIYQWTPLKQACLRRCRSPLDFLMTQWRDGGRGALVMGLRHGGFCLGCCWMLMLLLFVGGVMNLLWIAGLALFVLIEKLSPAGHWVGRAAGAVLVLWGIGTLAGGEW